MLKLSTTPDSLQPVSREREVLAKISSYNSELESILNDDGKSMNSPVTSSLSISTVASANLSNPIVLLTRIEMDAYQLKRKISCKYT